MKLREYDTRVEILRPSGVRNEFNEENGDLVSLGHRWAKVKTVSAREFIASGATEFGETTYRIEFRKDDLTSLIDHKYTLRFDGKDVDVKPVESRSRWKVEIVGRG